MDYWIIETIDESLTQANCDLMNAVKAWVYLGWKPAGGPYVARVDDHDHYSEYVEFMHCVSQALFWDKPEEAVYVEA